MLSTYALISIYCVVTPAITYIYIHYLLEYICDVCVLCVPCHKYGAKP